MIRHLNPVTLQQYLAGCAVKPLLLDVREEWEYEHCHIDGSRHIPMARIPDHIASLDPECETVLICHHGVRSHRVAVYLEGHGYKNLVNLDGGINAWATAVDPAMPRY